MNTQLYIDLATRLRATTDVNTIDIFNGQYADAQQWNSYSAPAVFIEFVQQQVTAINQRVAYREGRVRLHCVMTYTRNTTNIDKFDTTNQDDMLKPYGFPRQVQGALQGWKAASALSTFELANDEYNFGIQGVIVQIRTYTFQDCEDGAYTYKNYVPVNANLVIDGDVVEKVE